MIKAKYTHFLFYLFVMNSFSDYLSDKYSEISLDNPDHYKTIIIQKIVRMFHTLMELTQNSQDEVSSRCVLRGILDNLTTYIFIYQRRDLEDVMFRHYLYLLDGWRSYKDGIINMPFENINEKNRIISECDRVLKQIEDRLYCHPYYKLKQESAIKLIQDGNWKYESYQNKKRLKFKDLYKRTRLDENLSVYMHNYLSQFAHGLSFSNKHNSSSDDMKIVLYESIPIADSFIQAILQTFHDEDLFTHCYSSKRLEEFFKSKDLNVHDWVEFVHTLQRNDNSLLI